MALVTLPRETGGWSGKVDTGLGGGLSSAQLVTQSQPLVPAKAGTQGWQSADFAIVKLDSRLRGNERSWVRRAMIDKTYQPAQVEGRIYQTWEAAGAFRAG